MRSDEVRSLKEAEARALKEIGRRIRVVREDRKFSQEDAADRAEIDVKRWQRLERGKVNATVRTLIRVAAVLRIDFETLIAAKDFE